MKDIRSDLLERLEATMKQRAEWEARERRLRELLRDEESAHLCQTQPVPCPVSNSTTGVRLREFVLGSLEDGHDWSLEQLKEHARGIGLTTAGATGRSLNIMLVNLLRQGLVTRTRNGQWRLRAQGTQLSLELAS